MSRKTIVGELKDLFIKIGGNANTLTGKETTADMIGAIEQVYHDNGDTLPTVTGDDNGKMLGVVNGKWDKAEVPDELPAVTSTDNGEVLTVVGGEWGKAALPNNDFIVTYTKVNDTWTCDKTFAEIHSAIEAGKNVVAKATTDIGGGVTIEGILRPVATLKTNGTATNVAFETTNVSAIDDSLTIINITHTAEETITNKTTTYAAQG